MWHNYSSDHFETLKIALFLIINRFLVKKSASVGKILIEGGLYFKSYNVLLKIPCNFYEPIKTYEISKNWNKAKKRTIKKSRVRLWTRLYTGPVVSHRVVLWYRISFKCIDKPISQQLSGSIPKHKCVKCYTTFLQCISMVPLPELEFNSGTLVPFIDYI